jgi:catechol 2,3-dioxygenase-like lactoylglutathione lyase family enzyme
MTIQRMDHVGIVFDDLAAATEFFVELGLELKGEGQVEGRWVSSVSAAQRHCRRRLEVSAARLIESVARS